VWLSQCAFKKAHLLPKFAAVAVALVGLLPDSAYAGSAPSLQANCTQGANTSLVQRGAANYKFMGFINVFEAEFFDDPQHRKRPALDAVPKCLVLQYKRNFTAEQFRAVTIEGIEKNVSPATLKALRPAIDRFNLLYRDVAPGDRYSLTFVPGEGTVLAYNGAPRGRIEGDDFAAALFAIWLGRNSMDDDLTNELLGDS
jgi:hypothetical protein